MEAHATLCSSPWPARSRCARRPSMAAGRAAWPRALRGLGEGDGGGTRPRELDPDDQGLVHGGQGAHPQPADQGGVEPVVPSRGRPAAADDGLRRLGLPLLPQAQPDYCATMSGKLVQWRESHLLSGTPPRSAGYRRRSGHASAAADGQAQGARAAMARHEAHGRRALGLASGAGRRAATSGRGAPRASGSPRSAPRAGPCPGSHEHAAARRLHAQAQLGVGDAVAVVGAQLDRASSRSAPARPWRGAGRPRRRRSACPRSCRRRSRRRTRWAGPLPRGPAACRR